jgi:hypothetical protein
MFESREKWGFCAIDIANMYMWNFKQKLTKMEWNKLIALKIQGKHSYDHKWLKNIKGF